MKRRTFLSVLGMTPMMDMSGLTKGSGQQVSRTNSVKVIDSHVHVVDSGKALPQMMEELHEGYRLCGFDAICFAVNTCEGFHAIHRNLLAFVYKSLYPEHGYVFAGLDYHLPGSNRPEWDFLLQAERLIDIGADGFKMYEGKPNARKISGNIPLTSQRYEGFYDLLERRNIPLALHLADPPDFWEKDKAKSGQVANNWFFGDAAHSSRQEIYDECIAIIANHPRLRIIFPQFGYLKSNQVEELLRRFPNLYIDIAPGGTFDHLGEESAVFGRIAEEFSDRLLFACSGVASDLAGANAGKARRLLDGLHRLALPEGAETAILNGNFLSLCPQKPVNKAALKHYAGIVEKSLEGFPAKVADQATVQRTMEVISFIKKLT
ncbi:MAG: amidohydrolase [Tannerellaceae bacterium]|nr:amidohydrolase [Tannerellaceae bacterium]